MHRVWGTRTLPLTARAARTQHVHEPGTCRGAGHSRAPLYGQPRALRAYSPRAIVYRPVAGDTSEAAFAIPRPCSYAEQLEQLQRLLAASEAKETARVLQFRALAVERDDAIAHGQEENGQVKLQVADAKEQLLLHDSRLEHERTQHARTAAALARVKSKCDLIQRKRDEEEQTAADYTSNIQAAEDRLVEVKRKFSLLRDKQAHAEPRIKELEASAARANSLCAQVAQLVGALEFAKCDEVVAAAIHLALEMKSTADEESHAHAVKRHTTTVDRFQNLLSSMRKEQAASLEKLHSAVAKSGADDELIRSTSEAKGRAELRVLKLEAGKSKVEGQLAS